MQTTFEGHPQIVKAMNAQHRRRQKTYAATFFQVSAAALRMRNDDVAPGS